MPGLFDEAGNQTVGLFPIAVDGIKPQIEGIQTLRFGVKFQQIGRRNLGNSVVAVRLHAVVLAGSRAIEAVLRTASRVDIDRIRRTVFQQVHRPDDVGFVGQVDVTLLAVRTVGSQVENGAGLVFFEYLLHGNLRENIAVNDVLERHIQRFEPPGPRCVVREGVAVLAQLEYFIKKIDPNKTAGSENEDRAFQSQDFVGQCQRLLRHELRG